MKFEIFYRIGEHDDSLFVEGDTIEEIREIAEEELKARNATGLSSREIIDN